MSKIIQSDLIQDILYKFSNYWRNDPQNLLDKLSPSQAESAITQLINNAVVAGRIEEWLLWGATSETDVLKYMNERLKILNRELTKKGHNSGKDN